MGTIFQSHLDFPQDGPKDIFEGLNFHSNILLLTKKILQRLTINVHVNKGVKWSFLY